MEIDSTTKFPYVSVHVGSAIFYLGTAKGGGRGAKRIMRFGGGAQKMGLAWSVPISFKGRENDRSWTHGKEKNVS